jgi:hypothetical protein
MTTAPQLPAYADDDGLLHVWCQHCRLWHQHSPAAGHRVAHCADRDAPYKRTGYTLVPAGQWTPEVKRLVKRGVLLAELAR